MVSEATRILNELQSGNSAAAGELLPLVYGELRQLAVQRMQREQSDNTLQPTALVHEAYLRLVGDQQIEWDGRGHFFGAAAEAMRRILVESARRRKSLKRGGELERHDFDERDAPREESDTDDLLDLDDALNRLAKEEPELSKLVELRYFAGLNVDDAGKALGMSPRTVKRHWAFARAWLGTQLNSDSTSGR
ncbi:MAG: sigma-70 family RNA polymerase sigma factor [Planctomycetota bacterium]